MKRSLVLLVIGLCLFTARTSIAADAPKESPKPAEPARADDLKSVAAAIDGYVFKFPCKGTMPETPKKGADAESALVPEGADAKKNDNFTAEKTFGGEKGKRYL